ncbi:MAG: undecaprenyldiphospho-muramoylpentapeptide beta-N-acetylglucosaminyltransferase [Desulfobacterales bacterium]|jgi:UDP-N-acetylglucosamine--N-acetylmuramyl-(pentapeptide) pyrophosphoryl-undecaprenol N-acetylglucosamine transferase|nr:undecaprenyldiphospho-muramoylpentapeptide beta-N-acetylglucosaminyltransferase [Desulfobacterales bacterium]
MTTHGCGQLRIAIAGGGTGGHLFPGIAIAEEIRRRNDAHQVLFISRGNEFERAALAHAGFPLATISVEGLKGRGGWNQLRALGRLPVGIVQSILRLRAFRPRLVIGLGSYSAGPVVMAAWLLRIPVALCEQNVLPGVTNRVLARLADRIFTSFDRTEGGFDPAKIWWTGNPLRQQMVQSAAAESPAAGAPPKPFTVLVIGGSQGAHRVNTAVVEALRLLGDAADFFFIHQTGSADEAMVAAAYRQSGLAARVQPFFNDMAAQYAQADLVICRAGATTMAEITALGKTAVLIPYPHAADDHQQRNARRLVDAGAAEMIDEQTLDGERLAARIGFYASHPEISAEVAQRAARLGKPDAARRIVDECYRLVAARTPGRRTNGQTG